MHLVHAIVAAIVVHVGALQIDHDVRTVAVAYDCAPGAYCQTNPSLVDLPIGGQFANTHFTCNADSYLVYASLLFEPQSPTAYSVGFINETGLMIPYGTQVPYSFTCTGESYAAPH